MKTWHIKIWGSGTPHYLVSAPTKEEAWEMVEEEWRKKFDSLYVGDLGERDFFGYRYRSYQTIDELSEIKGLTTQTQMIIDLNLEI